MESFHGGKEIKRYLWWLESRREKEQKKKLGFTRIPRNVYKRIFDGLTL